MFNYILFSPAKKKQKQKQTYVSQRLSYLLGALLKGFLRAYNSEAIVLTKVPE